MVDCISFSNTFSNICSKFRNVKKLGASCIVTMNLSI